MLGLVFSDPNIFEMLKDLAKNSTTVYSRMPIEPTAAILKGQFRVADRSALNFSIA